MENKTLIEIDGSYGEGGGAILRLSTALSAFTSKPVKIVNIRSKRPKPGLMPQHLNAVKAVADLSRATVSGLEIGSTEVIFDPAHLSGGEYHVDIKTAGSITLILQAFLLPAAFADGPVKITVRGGTDVRWSPSVDYLENVNLPILRMMGYKAKTKLIRRGYYPRGGGIFEVDIGSISDMKPLKICGLQFKSINCISHATNLPRHVAERQAHSANKVLKQSGYGLKIEIEHSNNALGSGSGILLWTDGVIPVAGSSTGEPGKSAEKVGIEAANQILYHIKRQAALDRYMADQIIPLIAAAGKSTVKTAELTPHTLTNIHVTEMFINKKIQVEGKLGDPGIIKVE